MTDDGFPANSSPLYGGQRRSVVDRRLDPRIAAAGAGIFPADYQSTRAPRSGLGLKMLEPVKLKSNQTRQS